MKITVGIVSYLRENKLRGCLQSIINNKNDFDSVLVADNGPIHPSKRRMYDEFKRDLPLRVFDVNKTVSGARNLLVDKCDTDYFLLLDDDNSLLNIEPMKAVIENEAIGGVSPLLLDQERIAMKGKNLKREKDILTRDGKDFEVRKINGYPCYLLDFLPTSTLFKKECLEDSAWDENIGTGSEHIDFYYHHKLLKKWKFALALSVCIKHNPGGSKKYNKSRKNYERIKSNKRKFYDKYGLQGGLTRYRNYLDVNSSFFHSLKQQMRHKLPLKLVRSYDKLINKNEPTTI